MTIVNSGLKWLNEQFAFAHIHVPNIWRVNPNAAGTVYIRCQAIFRPINSTLSAMFCGRCLVNLILTFWRCIYFYKYNYFSSFGAGNCVSNSSFKWMKKSLKKIGSITSLRYEGLMSRPDQCSLDSRSATPWIYNTYYSINGPHQPSQTNY